MLFSSVCAQLLEPLLSLAASVRYSLWGQWLTALWEGRTEYQGLVCCGPQSRSDLGCSPFHIGDSGLSGEMELDVFVCPCR